MQPAHLGIFTADLASFLIISCAIGKKKNITWYLLSVIFDPVLAADINNIIQEQIEIILNSTVLHIFFFWKVTSRMVLEQYMYYIYELFFLKRHIFLTYASQGRPLVEVIVRLFLMIWHQSRTFHHNYWLLF